jgi:hypothetical protein
MREENARMTVRPTGLLSPRFGTKDTCPRIGSLRRNSGAATTRIGASRRPSTGSVSGGRNP